jgi:lipid II:glycine glycyltransferase (peptidoglycan interpeptide bridge formation enzyme)
MTVEYANNEQEWESFLTVQEWSPFLQSYAMGEVYQEVGEEPVRLVVLDEGKIVGVCQAIIVPARRGKHLAIMYGPIVGKFEENPNHQSPITKQIPNPKSQISQLLIDELKKVAFEKGCAFIRISPFIPVGARHATPLKKMGFRKSPLHMLAEHIWYLDLKGKTEDDVMVGMRKTTRNLVRRAEKEGVTVKASENPVEDLKIFFELYEETRKRHHFVPYPNNFIQSQVETFAPKNQCALYIARYKGEPVAASVHMIYGGETSYHHGASTNKYPKCFASYALQWKAIQDAIARNDHIYSFWGISPEGVKKHPFAGVRTFKTGFGGQAIELQHCMDLQLSKKYWITFGIETIRKIKRGF